MTLVVGETGPGASARQLAEDVRVAVTGWDAGALEPVAATLLSLFADDQRLALARQFIPLRPALFDRLITETAQANASFALTTGLAERADLVVTMGCGDTCPYIPGKRYVDWELPDPKGRPVEEVRAIRDGIAERVTRLIAELDAG